MSNTVYIDVNVKNAVNVNSTNNRFDYRLPNVMQLPTGTEIGLQSSIINLKGINGASVEINEDIEETIIYQYYSVDTTYDNPVQKPLEANVADLTDYKLVTDISVKHNITEEFPAATGVVTQDQLDNLSLAGYTENIMPLITQITCPDGTNMAVPMTGKSRIYIQKGIYSIEKLATKISEQINVNRLIDSENFDTTNQNFYKYRKQNQTWNGMFVNNSTCRNFQMEIIDRWKSVAAGTLTPDDPQFTYLPFDRLGALDYTQVNTNPTLGDQIKGLCTVIGVTPTTNQAVRANATAGNFSAALKDNAPVSFADICVTAGANARYFQGFEMSNGFTNPDSKRNYNATQYNTFHNGYAFGTTGFEMKYDTNNSGYSLSKLHEPRRIPTIDRFGTTLQNAGQECVFNKNLTATQAGGMADTLIRALTSIMSRTSGILVTNWAYNSARRLGDVQFNYNLPTLTDTQKAQIDEYRMFSNFFSTEEKADQAWQNTIWSRLGFQYKEIASIRKDGAGQTDINWYGNDQVLEGFTTDQSRDQSVLPQISTIYNPLEETGQDARIPGTGSGQVNRPPYRGALPKISNVQFFNMAGNNIPTDNYNNNLATAVGGVNVAAFEGSVYKNAVMIPVITTAKDFTARKLPTLSQNGYMLVTSDIVEPIDVLKNQQNTGILDVIPKSNLSNQDYIADRNVVTHTLSNPKAVNQISIAILNPDLTDIDLEPDSSFLFKISLPIPKPTNFLAMTAQNLKEQQVGGVLNQILQKGTDQKAEPTNLRMDVSNTLGGRDGGGDGIGDEDLDQIEMVLDAQRGLGIPDLQQDPFERDPNYRQPRFTPSLPTIGEAPLEPVEGASGSVGVPEAARERQRQQIEAKRQGQRGKFGADPAALAASTMAPAARKAMMAMRRPPQGAQEERQYSEVLANAISELNSIDTSLRDPRLDARQYQALARQRGIVEGMVQRLEAEGVQAVADPVPQAGGKPE